MAGRVGRPRPFHGLHYGPVAPPQPLGPAFRGGDRRHRQEGAARHTDAEGEEIELECRTWLVHDERGEPVAMAGIAQKAGTEPTFITEYAAYCRAGMPLVTFLCRALDLPV